MTDKTKKLSNDKQKPLRLSTHLKERVAQQSLADNLPAVSQPSKSERLDVGAPRSMDYKRTNISDIQLGVKRKHNNTSTSKPTELVNKLLLTFSYY